MTQSDLIADVLAELERPAMPREAFATTLLDELLPALDTGVAAPSGSSRSSRSTWRRWRFAALAAALLVFVTGVAAATYLVSRDSSPARARGVLNGPLTLLAFDRVLAVGLDGRRHTVWRCPAATAVLPASPGHATGNDSPLRSLSSAGLLRARGCTWWMLMGMCSFMLGASSWGVESSTTLHGHPTAERSPTHARAGCCTSLALMARTRGRSAPGWRVGTPRRHGRPTGATSPSPSGPRSGRPRSTPPTRPAANCGSLQGAAQVQPGHPTAQRSPTGPDAEASNSSPHRVAT